MASKKNYYYIENIGCDDKTVKSIIENLNKNSTYACMPKIEVYNIDESFIGPATDEDSDNEIMFTTKATMYYPKVSITITLSRSEMK